MLINCEICKKEFKITPSRFKNNLHHTCSKKCTGALASIRFSKKIQTNCLECNKEIFYKKSHYKEVAFPTCSRACAAKNKSKRNKGKNNPRSLNLTKEERFFWDKANNYAYRAKAKNLEYNLDYKFLQQLYYKQKGECFYTKFPMKIHGKKNFDTLSLDRIDSNKGYIMDNVVFCINSINMFKSSYHVEDMKEVFRYINLIGQQNVNVRVKKLDNSATLPQKAFKQDAAFDIVATSEKIENGFIEYGTGLSFSIPNNFGLFIFSRSSISKKDLILCNSVGILDPGFLGELKIRFKVIKNKLYEKEGSAYNTNETYSINKYNIGDRVAQVILLPLPRVDFEEVESLEDSERGAGGFGSSGT